MRFELTVALKYLIPRRRQLSVSIISLISVLVISLVVWLIVLFLSVTEGIEKKWIEELVALNAPVRMAPKEAYYKSYYYQIDHVSSLSNYSSKTIGEKLASLQPDPYDPSFDAELPSDFPKPDLLADGSLKDIVREGWSAALSLKEEIDARPQEYEVSFGNLRLSVPHDDSDGHQTFLTQVSYFASLDSENKRLQKLILPLTGKDYTHLFKMLSASFEEGQASSHALAAFFEPIEKFTLETTNNFVLSHELFPKAGKLAGIGIIDENQLKKIVLPSSSSRLKALVKEFTEKGIETEALEIVFEEKAFRIPSTKGISISNKILFELERGIPLEASLAANDPIAFNVKGHIQGISLEGIVPFRNLAFKHVVLKDSSLFKEEPFWVYTDAEGHCTIPCTHSFGDGVLIAKQYQSSGVRVGDRGSLAYYAPTASSLQEQRIPIYVAGFYDPGIMPIGNKLIFADPSIVAQLRDNMAVADSMLGNGINIWLNELSQAANVKNQLINILKEKGLSNYWEVQSYQDYEFAKPLLQQLKSDKNLFTLVAIIILIVACSNIVSMLILLVNDKRREIGILQSMGASPKRIACIFGACGFITGLIGSLIGTAVAALTLYYLKYLVNFLSFLQGHEAFQTAFYGNSLPNKLSVSSLLFVVISTIIISLIAGIIPAIKAARIRPSETLKAE